MQRSPLWTYLQRVQKALKSGNADGQDIAICHLQEFLDTACFDYFPSRVYPLVLRVLRYYCCDILPQLQLAAEDRQYVQEGFAATIARLEAQKQQAFEIEQQMQSFMTGLKASTFADAAEMVAALQRIAGEMPGLQIDRDRYVAAQPPDSPPGRGQGWVAVGGEMLTSRTHPCPSQEGNSDSRSGSQIKIPTFVSPSQEGISDSRSGKHHKIPTPDPSQEGNSDSRSGSSDKIPPPVRELREVEHAYRQLRKSPFTAGTMTPFLEMLLKTAFSEEASVSFAPLRYIFWDQAAEQVQMKAVLVNPLTREARITRLDVWTALDPDGVDQLTFDNEVDDRLFSSCWQALEAARRLLEQQFPDLLGCKGIHVTCRFSDPTVEYFDASVSALVGLKVVGDLLNLPVDPAAIISAEVDRKGKILPVNHIVAKVMAADQHPAIEVLYLPFESVPVRVERIALRRVASFSEAVRQYYGTAYQQKQQQVSRRKILKGAVGLALAPFTFSIVKHLFLRSENPVTECDWQLLECARDLCYHKSDYQNAQVILHTLLDKFEKSAASTEGIRITADALDLLGIITLRQNGQQRSLTLFSQSLKLWQSVNDRERQIETLFHLGDIYRYAVMTDGARTTGQQGLQYYTQAKALASSVLKKSQLFLGRYYGVSSYIYYWTDDYSLAEEYSRECLQYGQGLEHTWDYQTASQQLGRILIQRKKFEQAFDLLRETAESPVLQNPYDRVKSLWTLSDLFFAMGNPAEGLEYANQSKQLCQDFGLHLQLRTLQRVLRKYDVSSTRKSI